MSPPKSDPHPACRWFTLWMGKDGQMHYYQFNIKDYQSHTGHLDDLEDLAYRRLLDWCYLHERPLPSDPAEVARLIRMRSHSECIATVLREFFVSTKDGWVSERVEREIRRMSSKSDKARESAKARWNKSLDANASETQSEGNAIQYPIPNTQDTETNVSVAKQASPDCPHEQILALWAEALPTAIQPREWTPSRQAALRARWREKTKRQDLDWWRKLFEWIGESDFLMGRTSSPGRQPMNVSLDWVLKQENLAKIIEGRYHGKESA